MGKCILLVEDNPDDEKLTIRALRKHNVVNEVVTARDGVEALGHLFGSAEHGTAHPPSIAGADSSGSEAAPARRTGSAAARARRRANAAATGVVLTSSKEEQDLIRSYNLGANSYIRKPVDFTQFTDAVKQLGLYWLVLNESPPA